MEIIDRYVAEVGRNLPEKSRPDITREIRSLLEDALEDRSKAAGRAPDEGMTVALLKEFGAPAKVAASYLPPRYLIGPQLYPTFMTVLKVVMTILVVVMLIQFGVALTRAGQSIGEFVAVFAQLRANLMGGLVRGLGTLVIVFAIIQWTTPNLKVPDMDWDPRKLPPVDKHEKPVKIVELAMELVFTVVAIVLFNFYADHVGIYLMRGEEWRFVPFLSQAFFSYVPALTVLWGLTVIKDLWVIRDNRWTTASRVFSIALQVFTVGILIAMLSGAPIFALGPEAVESLGWMGANAATVQALETSLMLSMRLVLAFAILGSGVELIKEVFKLWIQPRVSPVLPG